VLCKEHEYRDVKQYAAAHGIRPKEQGLTCPWYDGRCTVYDVRPFVCRMFGHVPEMNCPRGYNVNISASAERRAKRDYGASRGTERMLHEILVEHLPLADQQARLEIILGVKREPQ
jgi:Fe-S-cluster containining protein